MIPAPVEAIKSAANIFRNIFCFGYIFKSTTSPTPVLAQRPDMKDAKLRIPCAYSLVSRMEEAQLGINPITAVRIG